MSSVLIRKRASYGLELLDSLTGRPLLGTSGASARGSLVEPFLVGPSRWVFEGLAPGSAVFDVSARYYLPRVLSADGSSLPLAPGPTDAPPCIEVIMLPAPGYPFPSALTRVSGRVRLDASVDPSTPPVAGATVSVIPRHVSGASTVEGSALVTTTDDHGLFVMWLSPVPGSDPQLANEYRLLVNAELGSPPSSYVGSLSPTTLSPLVVNASPTVFLTLAP